MKRNNIILIALILGLALLGCKKNGFYNLTPKIVDDKVEVTATTTTFTWTVDWPGKLVSVVEVSENEDMTDSRFYGSEEETNNHDFTVTATGLEEATKYYYRFLVWNRNFVDDKFVMGTKALETPDVPKVMTTTAIGISYCTATIGGEVSNDGGDMVTERGVYWGTTNNPTTKIAIGSGTGAYGQQITGLSEKTVYYYKAYAVNGAGESCGDVMCFTTKALTNGLFSINSLGNQVYFSQGNLQYQASTNTWRFAENQWDFVGTQNPGSGYAGGTVSGSDNGNIAPTYSGWIDLFGWGTSGYDHGAQDYQPWSTSTNYNSYFAYGNSTGSLYNQTGQADWGYNAISNGDNTENSGWRTLRISEWDYICFTRTTASGIRYVHATVNNVPGVILLPDNWTTSIYALNSHISNTITTADWTDILEVNGAVFLPVAGVRNGTKVHRINDYGIYWSSSFDNGSTPYVRGLGFDTFNISTTSDACRYYGSSVRLVRDYNP